MEPVGAAPGSPTAGGSRRMSTSKKAALALSILAIAGVVAALVVTLGFGPKKEQASSDSTPTKTLADNKAEAAVGGVVNDFNGFYSEQLNNKPIFSSDLVTPSGKPLDTKNVIVSGDDASPNSANGRWWRICMCAPFTCLYHAFDR